MYQILIHIIVIIQMQQVTKSHYCLFISTFFLHVRPNQEHFTHRFFHQHTLRIALSTIGLYFYLCNWLNLLLALILFWSQSSHWRIFHTYWEVTIAGEGLQIFTFAQHSWLLSSEGFLTFHTYCDLGHPFIMVISEDPWHSSIAERLPINTCFYDLGLSNPDLLHTRRTPPRRSICNIVDIVHLYEI